MINNPTQQLGAIAARTGIDRTIDDETLFTLFAGERLKETADERHAQREQKSPPIAA